LLIIFYAIQVKIAILTLTQVFDEQMDFIYAVITVYNLSYN